MAGVGGADVVDVIRPVYVLGVVCRGEVQGDKVPGVTDPWGNH